MKASSIVSAVALAASITVAGGAAALAATDASPRQRNCFDTTQWRGWSSPSSDTLYLRINNRDVYRVGLVGKPDGHSIKTPGSFLVSKPRGSNYVCSAIDLNLSVSDTSGFHRPLFPRSLTKLTPEEVAAIPAKYRP